MLREMGHKISLNRGCYSKIRIFGGLLETRVIRNHINGTSVNSTPPVIFNERGSWKIFGSLSNQLVLNLLGEASCWHRQFSNVN